jgi:hypothetical protein
MYCLCCVIVSSAMLVCLQIADGDSIADHRTEYAL